MDAQNDKMDGIQNSIDKAEEDRKKDAEKKNEQIDLIRQHLTLTDDLEVLTLGLPIAFNQSYDNATRMLYTALGLSQNKIPLFDYREWSPI